MKFTDRFASKNKQYAQAGAMIESLQPDTVSQRAVVLTRKIVDLTKLNYILERHPHHAQAMVGEDADSQAYIARQKEELAAAEQQYLVLCSEACNSTKEADIYKEQAQKMLDRLKSYALQQLESGVSQHI